jgi:hypothetical protein
LIFIFCNVNFTFLILIHYLEFFFENIGDKSNVLTFYYYLNSRLMEMH